MCFFILLLCTPQSALSQQRCGSTLQVKHWNAASRIAVLRVGRDCNAQLQALLPLLSRVDKQAVRVRTLHCAGTIRLLSRAAARWLLRQQSALTRTDIQTIAKLKA